MAKLVTAAMRPNCFGRDLNVLVIQAKFKSSYTVNTFFYLKINSLLIFARLTYIFYTSWEM